MKKDQDSFVTLIHTASIRIVDISSRWIYLFVSILVIVLHFQSCDTQNLMTPKSEIVDDTPTTLRENREAEEAALWLSGELIAPEALYEMIRDDLTAIRQTYMDDIPELSIEFRSSWIPTRIIVKVPTDTSDTNIHFDSSEIDSLNIIFGGTITDTSHYGLNTWLTIHFEGRYNTPMLSDIYNDLETVLSAACDGWVGDYSNLYPWEIENGYSYLLREGSGDCPAGCIHNRFWYFRVVNGEIEFVGYGEDPQWMSVGETPEWWEEARVAYYHFKGFSGY